MSVRQTARYRRIMKKINLADDTILHIPEGPLGIFCSGGTDSSLLLYLLMANTKEKIHTFTLSNNFKGRANALVTMRVVEKCIQLTGNHNVVCHSWFEEIQTEENLFKPAMKFILDGTVKSLYHGVTSNPPSSATENFFDKKAEMKDRTMNLQKSEISDNGLVYSPFVNRDKSTIAKIYRDLNLLDSLFPLTRSCEAVNRLEYYDHCGECWWCEERFWGFGRYV